MDSTHKITRILIALFLVIGIYSYFESGTFLTPFFLNFPLFICVAIWAAIKGIKTKNNALNWIYCFGIIALGLVNQTIIKLIGSYFNLDNLINHQFSPLVQVLGLILFFLALIIVDINRIKQLKFNILNFIPFILLCFALIFSLLNYHTFQFVFLLLYMVSFYISIQAKHHSYTAQYLTLSSQFILFATLETIRFFSTI